MFRRPSTNPRGGDPDDRATALSASRLTLLLLAGLAVRLLLIFTTIGTNDVIFWIAWSNLIEKYGIAHAYAVAPLLNHPPLSLAILHILRLLANVTHIELTDLLRLVQVAADVVSTLALVRIARKAGWSDPWWPGLFFFLTPTAMFISGFHCNTDPTMVMLMVVALCFFVHERDVVAGGALALAASIKVPALLLLPFLVVAARSRWWRVVCGFLVATLVTWTPALVSGGPVVLKNVFGYHGLAWWGLPSLTDDFAQWTGRRSLFDPMTALYLRHGHAVTIAALAVVGAVFLLRAVRRDSASARREALSVAPVVFLVFLSFTAGFGIQYIVWPLAFVPFLFGRRASLFWSLATSLFSFVVYTHWNGGLPWWFANSMQRPPVSPSLFRAIHLLWILMWITTVSYAVSGVRLWLNRPAGFRDDLAASSGQ